MPETFLNKAQLTGLSADARRTEILRAKATSPTPWTAVSFQNSWVNYGGSEQVVQYRKVGDRVELRGSFKNGTVNTVVFTLPSGFRPPADLGLPMTSFEASAYVLGHVLINPDGTVNHRSSGNDYCTVDGISFSVTA